MNTFNQFGITTSVKGFEGDKIKIKRILNCEIIVHHFKIEDSKVFKERGTCKCLYLQIEYNKEKHIVFTSSGGLIEAIQQIPDGGFPFLTTIIQENDRYKFS